MKKTSIIALSIWMPCNLFAMEREAQPHPLSSVCISTTLKNNTRSVDTFWSSSTYLRDHAGDYTLNYARIEHLNQNGAANVRKEYEQSIGNRFKTIIKKLFAPRTTFFSQASDVPHALIAELLDEVDPKTAQYKVLLSLLAINERHHTATIQYSVHKQFQNTSITIQHPKTIHLTLNPQYGHVITIKGLPNNCVELDDYTLNITARISNG